MQIAINEGNNELNVSLNPIPSGTFLELPTINVLSLNGISFSEVGNGGFQIPCRSCDGTGVVLLPAPVPGGYTEYPCSTCGGTGLEALSGYWVRLPNRIIKDTLFQAVTINMYNKSIWLREGDYRDLGCNIFYQISGGPSWQGRSFVQLYEDEGGYKYRKPPFYFTSTPYNVIGAGSWKPKVYSAEIRIFAQYWESSVGQATIGRFFALEFLECTGSGSVSV